MFCGRKTNARINCVHERTLRIVYRNNSICFDELLKIDKLYNIHHKNIAGDYWKTSKLKILNRFCSSRYQHNLRRRAFVEISFIKDLECYS